jgi:phosphatidylglycerophosphatase A
MQNLPDTVYIGLTGLMLIAGIRICGQTGSALNSKDPQGIDWDEIVGYLLTMVMAPPGWVWVISGFLIFRFFDIVKPWPVSWADRRLNGGLGIMMDDAIAGLYGCLVLQMTAAWY